MLSNGREPLSYSFFAGIEMGTYDDFSFDEILSMTTIFNNCIFMYNEKLNV